LDKAREDLRTSKKKDGDRNLFGGGGGRQQAPTEKTTNSIGKELRSEKWVTLEKGGGETIFHEKTSYGDVGVTAQKLWEGKTGPKLYGDHNQGKTFREGNQKREKPKKSLVEGAESHS